MSKSNKIVKKDTHKKKDYMNPAWGIYVLHGLQGQFSGCHFLMCVLKQLTSSNSFSVLGAKFYIRGPKLNKLSDSW